ncbi:hypothetical protein SCHPADRAFT_380582 [Schizopora paradoxa]|uniref:CoA-dependent acyltransferase n=1 Tax=Schizopora paradoxa TaxID=27342 RepID=A0A0H2S8F5_9AGAM|nr:hypothetical protein SCHPADRAFT_380582 [Schizopora paradoxa]
MAIRCIVTPWHTEVVSRTMSSVDMQDEVFWVHPPTQPIGLRTRVGTRTMPLSGMNQIFNPCNQVFILPGPIDLDRLQKAIQSWLILVPHAAGRLTKEKDHSWAIKLSYPIPITVSNYAGTYTEDELYNVFPPILDPIPWVYWPPQDMENHPLTRFKITNLTRTGETAVAIHMCHAVVDGISLFRVLNMLNDLYCGAKLTSQKPVSFENYLGPPPPYLDPTGDAYARALERTPILKKGYDPETHLNKWMQSMLDTDRVDLYFTKDQMEILVQRANALLPAGTAHVKAASVLPAYLFTVLNRAYGRPKFNRALSVLGVRGQSAPEGSSYEFPSKTSGGMAIVQTVSEPFPTKDLFDFSALAVRLRDHTVDSMKPDTLLDITSVYEQRQLELAKKEEIAWMLPEDGDGILGINLMHRTEVRIHFGYGANQCRFITWPAIKHYLRAFMANPVQLDNGKWDARDDVIHVMFLVEKGFGNRIRDMVCEDLDAWTAEDARRQPLRAKM